MLFMYSDMKKKDIFLCIGCLLAVLLIAWIMKSPCLKSESFQASPSIEMDPSSTVPLMNAFMKGVSEGVSKKKDS